MCLDVGEALVLARERCFGMTDTGKTTETSQRVLPLRNKGPQRVAAAESGYSSMPSSPGAPRIGAFYPGFGFSPSVPTEAPCPPGVTPFGQTFRPLSVVNPPYTQSNANAYGVLYPTPSYDVSIALAALAVGEARALLESTQELRRAASAAPAPAIDKGTFKRAQATEEAPKANLRFNTWRRNRPLGKSRSDVASWRKDGSMPIARSVTVPANGSTTFLDRFKSTRGHGCSLQDVKGNVALVALDQMGSRWLQRELDEVGLSGAQLIVQEVLQNALLLSRDVFGNYVIQKTMEHVDQENKDAVGHAIKGRMRRLSFDVYGCRVVQKLIESVSTSLAVELAQELEEVVLSCVTDTNASHVLQKCFQFLPSDRINFLHEPLYGHIQYLSKNPTGCRIVQRLIEYCSVQDIRNRVLDEIIDSLTDLAGSEYGNYVVQHVAKHGGPKHRAKALHRIGTNFRLYSHNRYASRVVESFLSYSNEEEKRYMLESMFSLGEDGFNEESWVVDMILDPFANYIVQKILEVTEERTRSMFVDVIRKNNAQLIRSSYGRSVVEAAINMGLLTALELRSTDSATSEGSSCE